ncbi:SPOR domain-containing protein [Nioella nitratireducens]|uniref:SPOR domain-containing protein n=1 Tax=Nioella nitratireducens TaxID=1287720 RepID=UPI0008FD006C|nr:SPOR domain-containing protein [Nioella nitratireducens]
MRLLRTISGLALVAVLSAPASAQSTASMSGPAEFPPSSFSGAQYVDSNGCVFIRVGYGGETNWVPRVTRDRQPICGQQPTFGAAAPVSVATGPAPTEAPDLPDAPAAPQVTVATAPEARPVQPQTAQPQPVQPQPTIAAAAPAPTQPVQTATARPVPAPAAARPVRTPAAPAMVSCQGLPAGAAHYMRGADVRCGPQAIHPADGQPVIRTAAIRAGITTSAPSATGAAASAGAPPLTPLIVPEGYRPAWDDGRLNAYRGLAMATPQGNAEMAQVWSNTLPRVAIQPDPAADGVPVPRTAMVTRASSTPTLAVSDSDSAPETPVVRVSSTDRFVEVARFTDRDSADAARRALQQRGLATHLGGLRHGGQVRGYLVLAGPFEDPQLLGRILVQARRFGYPGATTR